MPGTTLKVSTLRMPRGLAATVHTPYTRLASGAPDGHLLGASP